MNLAPLTESGPLRLTPGGAGVTNHMNEYRDVLTNEADYGNSKESSRLSIGIIRGN